MNGNRSIPAGAMIPELSNPDVAAAADWLFFSQAVQDVDPATWGGTLVGR